jgi:ribonucleoside-diphosphate reductase alpha chain
MMGAVQPFISGAISKTVNMPADATVDDVTEAYLEAWRDGLKAIAIYRDGCKQTQPLNTGKTAEAAKTVEARPTRRRLQNDCKSERHKFEIAGHEGYIHVGFYEDGTPGEIFIKMAKEGSTISGLMDTIATLTSMALQYGVPLEVLVNKFAHVRFEPSGFTKNPEIPMAKSLTDYIFRFLGSRFFSPEQRREVGLAEIQAVEARPVVRAEVEATLRATMSFSPQADAPSCSDCGSIMVRNGSCYKCLNCGATSGCS